MLQVSKMQVLVKRFQKEKGRPKRRKSSTRMNFGPCHRQHPPIPVQDVDFPQPNEAQAEANTKDEAVEHFSLFTASIIGIAGAALVLLGVAVRTIVNRRRSQTDEEKWKRSEMEMGEPEEQFQLNSPSIRGSSEYSM